MCCRSMLLYISVGVMTLHGVIEPGFFIYSMIVVDGFLKPFGLSSEVAVQFHQGSK